MLYAIVHEIDPHVILPPTHPTRPEAAARCVELLRHLTGFEVVEVEDAPAEKP